MTLSKQLAWNIIGLLFLLFVGTFSISMLHMRHFVEEQLGVHAQDAATALGIALTHSLEDPILIERMVDAMMDSGYYANIQILDTNNQPLIPQRTSTHIPESVPQYLVQHVSFHIPSKTAEVLNGWKNAGIVKVTAHPGFAYLLLWKSLRDLGLWYAFGSLCAAILGVIALRSLLKPLHEIVKQAQGIANREFPIQDHLPPNKDLRHVVQVMNRMSKRLHAAFEEQSRLIDQFRREAYTDPVTELGNHRYFENQLRHVLNDLPETDTIAVGVLELKHFEHYNKRWGYEAGNAYLRQISQALRTHLMPIKNALITRYLGTSFAFLIPHANKSQLRAIGNGIIAETRAIETQAQHSFLDTTHVGIYSTHPHEELHHVLKQMDNALKNAQQRTANTVYVIESEHQAVEAFQLSADMLSHFLEVKEASLRFEWTSILTFENEPKVIHQMFVFKIKVLGHDVHSKTLSHYADDYALAGLYHRFVISKIFEEMNSNASRIAIPISGEALQDQHFLVWLRGTALKNRVKFEKLDFEFQEHVALQHLEILQTFLELVKPLGSRVGLTQFGRHFSSIAYLHRVHFDYLKIDASLAGHIEHDPHQQFYFRALSTIAHDLEMQIMVQGNFDPQAKEMLKRLQFDGIQGNEPKPSLQ